MADFGMTDFTRSNFTGGISADDLPRRDIFKGGGCGAHNRSVSDMDIGADECVRTNPGVIIDSNRRFD